MIAVCLIDSENKYEKSVGTNINDYQGVYVIHKDNCEVSGNSFLGYEIKYIKRNRVSRKFETSELEKIDNIKDGVIAEDIYISHSLIEIKYLYLSWSNAVGVYKFCPSIANSQYYLGVIENSTEDTPQKTTYVKYNIIRRRAEYIKERLSVLRVEDECLDKKVKNLANLVHNLFYSYGDSLKITCSRSKLGYSSVVKKEERVCWDFETFRWERLGLAFKSYKLEGMETEFAILFGYVLYHYLNPYIDIDELTDAYKKYIGYYENIDDILDITKKQFKLNYKENKLDKYIGFNYADLYPKDLGWFRENKLKIAESRISKNLGTTENSDEDTKLDESMTSKDKEGLNHRNPVSGQIEGVSLDSEICNSKGLSDLNHRNPVSYKENECISSESDSLIHRNFVSGSEELEDTIKPDSLIHRNFVSGSDEVDDKLKLDSLNQRNPVSYILDVEDSDEDENLINVEEYAVKEENKIERTPIDEEDIINEQDIYKLFGGIDPNLAPDSVDFKLANQKKERDAELKSILDLNKDKLRQEELERQRREANLFKDAFTDESIDLDDLYKSTDRMPVQKMEYIDGEDTPGEKSCPVCKGAGVTISKELGMPVICDCVDRKRKRIEERIEKVKDRVIDVPEGIDDICIAENLIIPTRIKEVFSISTALINLNDYMQNNELSMDKSTLKLVKAAINSITMDCNGSKRLSKSLLINLPNGIGKTTLANTCIKSLRTRNKRAVPYRSLSELAKLREEYSRRLLYNNNKPVNPDEDFLGFRYKWEDYLTAETVFCFLAEIDKISAQLELSTLKTLVSIRGNNGLPTVIFTDRGIQAYEKNEKLKKFVLPDLIAREPKHAALDMPWYITLKTKKKVGLGLQPGKDI